MRKRQLVFHIIFLFLFLGVSTLSFAEPTTEELYYTDLVEDYVPQKTPQGTFAMELKLMTDSTYCYDLPIFDPEWRTKGKAILTKPVFVDAAKAFLAPAQTYIKDTRAIIYYPDHFNLNPIFLYQEKDGWIL